MRCERESVGVVSPTWLPSDLWQRQEVMAVRFVGVDIHREFAEVAVLEDGVVRGGGRVEATPEGIRVLADSLAPDDQVAIEATVNTMAVAKLLEERVARFTGPPPHAR
jgi:hypothetical protein